MVEDFKFIASLLSFAEAGEWQLVKDRLGRKRQRQRLKISMDAYELVEYKNSEDGGKIILKMQLGGSTKYILKMIAESSVSEAKPEILAGIIATCHVPNTVVPILNAGYMDGFFHIFYPYIHQGSMKKYLQPTDQVGLPYELDAKKNPYVFWIMVRRTMEALAELHSVSEIVHFDGRSDNLFVQISYDWEWLEGGFATPREPLKLRTLLDRLLMQRRIRRRRARGPVPQPAQERPAQERRFIEDGSELVDEIRDVPGDYTFRVLVGDLGMAEFTTSNGKRMVCPEHHRGAEYIQTWGTYPSEFCPSYDAWYFLICFQDDLARIKKRKWMKPIWDKIRTRIPGFSWKTHFTEQGRMLTHIPLLPVTVIDILDEIYAEHQSLFDRAKMG